MSDFAAPSGPPPPKVPAGWKAQWNDQYQEWFYVNVYTKKSQWDRPTSPVYPHDEGTPAGPPPGYIGGGGYSSYPSDYKGNPYDNDVESDEAIARRLQAEEDERAAGRASASTSRNAFQDYQNTPLPPSSTSPQPSAELPPREQKRGFLGKLLGGGRPSGSSSNYGGGQSYNQQPAYGGGAGYGQQQYQPQQPGYGGGGYGGGYSQQGYGAGPGYGPGPGYGGGYPQQQQQQAPQRQGMGAMGGAALGLGGGLLGGMLLEDAIDGGDGGGDGGGDDGGGDDGGGGD